MTKIRAAKRKIPAQHRRCSTSFALDDCGAGPDGKRTGAIQSTCMRIVALVSLSTISIHLVEPVDGVPPDRQWLCEIAEFQPAIELDAPVPGERVLAHTWWVGSRAVRGVTSNSVKPRGSQSSF